MASGSADLRRVLLVVAGRAADARDVGIGGWFWQGLAMQLMLMMLASERCFWQWPAVQLMLMMASGVLLAVAGDAADAHDAGFGGAFGSCWRCS